MTDSSLAPIKQALISVSDKTGIVEFAQALSAMNIELISTGGTYSLLSDAGLNVREISNYTGFPEMMDGRVKTLHPKVHGGILGRRGIDNDLMSAHGIEAIDLVVVNLYPFAATVANPNCTQEEAIENIDIGGPTMVRSAAKNHRDVTIIVNASDYQRVLTELQETGGATRYETRFDLAIKAFEHTARYDAAIANHFGQFVAGGEPRFPRTYTKQYRKVETMRYGENPHQEAAFYTEQQPPAASIASTRQVQGKALSYNNVADTDAALECVKVFEAPSCVIVKHANPCGVASAETLVTAYQKAFETDRESAFGGIIAFNRALDAVTARAIIDQQFVEVIIAPTVEPDALPILAEKTNVRVLTTEQWTPTSAALDIKQVHGGILLQDRDLGLVTANELTVVSQRAPTSTELTDLLFAWKVAKFVKSNAIVYAQNERTIGVGAGQMSRVNSARIAAIKAEHAGLAVSGSVMASDAFFPFRDGIDNAAKSGITAVIQPGGSIRDDEVIAAADEANIAMVFTGMRHFRH